MYVHIGIARAMQHTRAPLFGLMHVHAHACVCAFEFNVFNLFIALGLFTLVHKDVYTKAGCHSVKPAVYEVELNARISRHTADVFKFSGAGTDQFAGMCVLVCLCAFMGVRFYILTPHHKSYVFSKCKRANACSHICLMCFGYVCMGALFSLFSPVFSLNFFHIFTLS